MDDQKTILLISNEPWGDIWFSKHHYANELSKLGHQVYFVNPPSPWKVQYFFKTKFIIRKEGNIQVIDYTNQYPSISPTSNFRKQNDRAFFQQIADRFGDMELLIWNFDPFRFVDKPDLPNYKYLLHIVDQYHINTDIQIATHADLVVLVTPSYKDRYKAITCPLTIIKHGVGDDDLNPNEEMVDSLTKEFGEYTLFIGTLNAGIDFELLHKYATTQVDQNLIILGSLDMNVSDYDKELISQIERLPNVHYPGSVPAKSLKNYIAASKVCIIPYKPSQSFRAQTLKAIHYMTQLKPIVSIELTDLRQFEGSSVFMANDQEEFLAHIQRIYTGDQSIDTTKVSEYIKEMRYPQLIKNIFSILYR